EREARQICSDNAPRCWFRFDLSARIPCHAWRIVPKPASLCKIRFVRYHPAVPKYSIGFDFGTESVRVLVVDVSNGHIAAQAAHAYRHGVIDQTLPTTGEKLPPDYALQH